MTSEIRDPITKSLYAVLINKKLATKNKTYWVGDSFSSLQGSIMSYDSGKLFANHKHKLNPRIINRTQEAFFVVSGKIKLSIWSDSKIWLGELIASTGEAIFIWKGFHELIILEDDTVAYEIKAGSFTSVEDDKEYF